jgi:hypothetical protein
VKLPQVPDALRIVGWREWVALPNLGIDRIKAKVDTGARSSALHAFDVEVFRKRGSDWVRFKVHPIQRNTRRTVSAQARLLEYRKVRSSAGHESVRPVIVTSLTLLDRTWDIELTLASRDAMGFRMLLGRQAVRDHLVVDPGKSYYGGSRRGRS